MSKRIPKPRAAQPNREPVGSVEVANEVVQMIAAMAAEEVDGVAGTDPLAARRAGDWLRHRTAHRGVKVELDSERSLHLDVFITVNANVEFHRVAQKVQANVAEAVGKMLGMDVAEVNVYVTNVAF